MKVILFANTDWYLFNFRRSLAESLVSAGHEVLLLSPEGPYGERLLALGLRWEPVPMVRRSLAPWREAMFLVSLGRILRSEQPEVVHNFTVKCAIHGSLAARIFVKSARRVNAIAGLGYVFASDDRLARTLRPMVRSLLRLALGGINARLIVQNANDARQLLRAKLVEEGSVRLIPSSGVNCARFATNGEARPKAGEPLRVLLAARLLQQKGIREFVQAAQLMRAGGRLIEFLLAGMPDHGNPDTIAGDEVQRWADEGLVQWLGHVEDMAGLMARCNVMALPSYYGEGLPRSLAEGGASGLALITTDMPGCRDAVTDEITGLVIPPRDATALARAIARMDDDRAWTGRLGEAARNRAQTDFDERLVILRTIEVYEEALGDP